MKSIAILKMIAEGHSYSQIVDSRPDFSYRDVFDAAADALRLNRDATTEPHHDQRMAEIKANYPRAYENWNSEEDAELISLAARSVPNYELARHFQRQPSAITSRLEKLTLRRSEDRTNPVGSASADGLLSIRGKPVR